MAVIIQFGRLASSVAPIKGEPFNEFWSAVVPPLVPTPVTTLTVPAGTVKYFLQGLYCSSRFNSTIELRVNGTLVWVGGTDALVRTDLNAHFADGEIVASPTQVYELRVLHQYVSNLEFSGNLYGYKR